MNKADLVAALSDIARALRQVPEGEPVAWRADLLPGQVKRSFDYLRTEVKRLRRRAESVDRRPPRTLCVQCGPDVRVDEDGCCATCGATATGPWVKKVRVARA